MIRPKADGTRDANGRMHENGRSVDQVGRSLVEINGPNGRMVYLKKTVQFYHFLQCSLFSIDHPILIPFSFMDSRPLSLIVCRLDGQD